MSRVLCAGAVGLRRFVGGGKIPVRINIAAIISMITLIINDVALLDLVIEIIRKIIQKTIIDANIIAGKILCFFII